MYARNYEVYVELLNRLSHYLVVMGIPGLLAISFIDSAAVPLAGGPDAVLMLLAWQRPALTLVMVLVATVGSTLGCLVLYGIGAKGGERALARFNPERTAKIETRMRNYGIWPIIASVIAPPPFPTKLVVLAAGVLRIGKIRFAVAVFIGRFARYLLVGYLAAKFGDQAAQIIKEHYPAVSIVLIVVIVAMYLFRKWRNRNKPIAAL